MMPPQRPRPASAKVASAPAEAKFCEKRYTQKRIKENAIRVMEKVIQVVFPARAIRSGRMIPMVPVGAMTPRVWAVSSMKER